MAQNLSKTTTDHDEIRRWAEERGGKPAEVASTARGEDVGIIRIDFPGFGGEGKLREISWDDWFQKFDQANLAFVYQDETSGGERSNFNELVGRETASARSGGKRTSRRPAGAGRASTRGGGRTTQARAGGRKAAGRGAGTGRPSARGGRKTTRTAAKRGGQGRRSASRAEAARTAGRRSGTSRSGSRSGTRSRPSRRSR